MRPTTRTASDRTVELDDLDAPDLAPVAQPVLQVDGPDELDPPDDTDTRPPGRPGTGAVVVGLVLDLPPGVPVAIDAAVAVIDAWRADDVEVVVRLEGFLDAWAADPVGVTACVAAVADAGAGTVVIGGDTAGFAPDDVAAVVGAVGDLVDPGSGVRLGTGLTGDDALAATVLTAREGARVVDTGPDGVDVAALHAALERAARLDDLSDRGWDFDRAPASRELVLERTGDDATAAPFTVVRWACSLGAASRGMVAGATVDVLVDGRTVTGRGEAADVMTALCAAAHEALDPAFPALTEVVLTGLASTLVDTADGTAFRVVADFARAGRTWSTCGADPDPTVAGWRALRDGLDHALTGIAPRPERPRLTLLRAG